MDRMQNKTGQLKYAVETRYGGTAELAQSVHVHERHEGETVWEGVVHVFDVAGDPKAKRVYAWSSPRAKGEFFAVLHRGPVNGPVEAVRSVLMTEDGVYAQRDAVH